MYKTESYMFVRKSEYSRVAAIISAFLILYLEKVRVGFLFTILFVFLRRWHLMACMKTSIIQFVFEIV